MVKMKQQSKQDAYTSNLLISLLMRFPEIMSINFDMPHDQAKFTFTLTGCVDKTEITEFSQLLKESLSAFEELSGERLTVKTKLFRSHKLNLLEMSSCTTTLSLEGIQLICGLVSDYFSGQLMKEDYVTGFAPEDELLRQEEIIDYLLSHTTGTKQDNLIAFREAGKVFVYDK